MYWYLANRFSDDEAGEIMDNEVSDIVTSVLRVLRLEIESLRRQIERLEKDKQRCKALVDAWQFLAESNTNGDA